MHSPNAAANTNSDWDAIVIGSGMGGMTAATALARLNYRVLLLEQAQSIGGLTHTFSRAGFTWDVGLHYCGLFGHDQFAGRILDWLSGNRIEFRSMGTVYDVLHFPDGVDVSVGRPASAYKMELKERFPQQTEQIDAYFEALREAEIAMRMVTTERALPEPFRSAHQWWNKKKIERWCGRTTQEVIGEIVSDPKLAAVLTAQWGTYGGKPSEASFGVHALVIGHYLEGAAYPVGGASAIAAGLVPVIEAAGGSTRAGTAVSEIVIEDGQAVGVRTRSGETFRAPVIVSAVGARGTVRELLPAAFRQQDWAEEINTLKPAICHFEIFLGFEGDIARHGATRANHWYYQSWNTNDAIWSPNSEAPIPWMFISFPSLKDPDHDPGPCHKHTGEAFVWADWADVAEFADGGAQARPEQWRALKERVESKLKAIFAARFPALESMMVHCELGTPLATAAFTGHEKGGFYGLETTPRRLLTTALSAKTPLPGLYMAGQDVAVPGIAGALMGGMLGAAAVDPRVFQHFK